ncbi:MAG: hypothetical protein LBH16_09275 [Treponema sp.]|jgi:hypothetical protein|nr:hypothetical protein [Treponema sp.]
MGVHVTEYITENGRTRKVESASSKKEGARKGAPSGADKTIKTPETPANEGEKNE